VSDQLLTEFYIRHGTTSLFAALEVATGKVTDACYQRHTHAEFLDFLKLVAQAYLRASHAAVTSDACRSGERSLDTDLRHTYGPTAAPPSRCVH
jgi:hypothetical protein